MMCCYIKKTKTKDYLEDKKKSHLLIIPFLKITHRMRDAGMQLWDVDGGLTSHFFHVLFH